MDKDVNCAQNPTKRLKTENVSQLKINEIYHKHSESLSESFHKKTTLELENEAQLFSEPFTFCIMPNFIEPSESLIKLEEELHELKMEERINDLYHFFQSKDLRYCTEPNICNFKNFLKGEVLDWMRKITKIPLTEKIDIFCSCYIQTNHLLCHDDELEGRRIAFIYYLVPEWNKEDGGSLDLFNTVNGQPNEICKSVLPKWNNFVFFEVSPISYHQVSEVLSLKRRLALSGWFHGPPLKPSVPVREAILFKEPSNIEIDITEWISHKYLNIQTQLDIRETFEDESEISLSGFLKDAKYNEVCLALMDSKIKWNRKGPPNHRNVYEADINDDIPTILKECQALFTSKAFLLFLCAVTGLRVDPSYVDDEDEEDDDHDAHIGKVFSSIRKWCHGSYTLLHNHSFSQITALNANMYFNAEKWNAECGGYSSFVADGESDELLRVEPAYNSLALVYTTKDTSSFVKYINSNIKNENDSFSFFHDIFCVYLEEDVNDNKE